MDAKGRKCAYAHEHSRASSLTSYLGNANTVLRYVPQYYGSWGKIIGRSGHYGDIIPLGLKVYFLLVVAMTAPSRGRGDRPIGHCATRQNDIEVYRRRLPLRHLNRIRLTADRHVSTIVLSPLSCVMPCAHVTRIYIYKYDGFRESLRDFFSFSFSLSLSLPPSLCLSLFPPFFPDIVPHRLFLFLHSPRSRIAVSRSPRTPFETGRLALHGVYTLLSRYVSQFDVRRHNGAQGDQPPPRHI